MIYTVNDFRDEPYIVKVLAANITIFLFESLDGEDIGMYIKNTELEDVVGMLLHYHPTFFSDLPHYVELGLDADGDPYIQLRFTSEQFDQLPHNDRYRLSKSKRRYQEHKESYKVPSSICKGLDLYYSGS